MARMKKKECSSFSMRMDSGVYKRLEEFCDVSGMSKTTAVERAVTMFIDDWNNKQAKLETLSQK